MVKESILSQFGSNVNSQFGEDGILKRIFEILPDVNNWCVEFGAWDGKYLSNCYNLITNCHWDGVMIEANSNKFRELQKTYENNSKVYLINRFINLEGENTLDNILKATPTPKDLDLLSIDIDGNDYYVWESLKEYTPKVVVIEFNPSIPSDISFTQQYDNKVNQGSSLLAISTLGQSKGYELVATTECNAIFVKKEYFNLFNIKNNSLEVIWDTEIEAPRIFQLYDGTIVLSKEFDLLWHGIKVNKYDLQKLPTERRIYVDAQGVNKIPKKQYKKDSYLKRFLYKLYKIAP